MRIIGITGGIGSGKSTVAHELEHLGVTVVDADRIARDIVSKGSPVLTELVEAFGKEIITESGELDRKVLGDIVFNDRAKLEMLNSKTHKHIAANIINLVENAKHKGDIDVLAIEAAIPLKHGFLDQVDEVWVVIADKNIRIKRIMERNNVTYEKALAIIDSQMDEECYVKLADRVVLNNGSVEDLKVIVRDYLNRVTGDFVENRTPFSV